MSTITTLLDSLGPSTVIPTWFSNNSTEGDEKSNVADAAFDKTTRIIWLQVFIVLGIIGGILVCCWLWYNRRRKSRVNLLILNVTISDLSVILFASTMQLVWEYFDREWIAGRPMCKILKFLQTMVVMASNNMLVILSFDRHQAIRSPLREPMGVWKLCGIGWGIAIVLSTPQFYLFDMNIVDDPKSPYFNKTVCESLFRVLPGWHRTAYLTFVNIVVFYIPFVLIAVFYIRIFTKISSKVKESTGSCKQQGKPGKIRLVPSSSSSISKAKIKTLKMTIVIVITFFICTAPYQVMEIIYNWDHGLIPPVVAGLFSAMVPANSSINPYVFLLFNANVSCIRWFIKLPRREGGGYEPTTTGLSRTEYTMASSHADTHNKSTKFQETIVMGNVKNKQVANKSGNYRPVAQT